MSLQTPRGCNNPFSLEKKGLLRPRMEGKMSEWLSGFRGSLGGLRLFFLDIAAGILCQGNNAA